MSEQIDLLPWPPRSHTLDPATSKRAEKIVRNSGKMRDHLGAVYAIVSISHPITGSAIADRLCHNPLFSSDRHERLYQVRRRLSDLHKVYRLIEPQSSEGREIWWRLVK